MPYRYPTLLLTLLALTLRASAQDPIISPPVVVGPPPAPIAAVKTAAELEKQPLIEAGGGVNVRLGLEAHSGLSAGGLLFYCQWDGKGKAARMLNGDDNDQLVGPVRLRVERIPDPNEPRTLQDKAKRLAQVDRFDSPGIFVAAVKIPRAGKYHVDVYARDDTLLARQEIEGQKEMAPDWRPWQRGVKNAAENPVLESVRIAGTSAIPRWESVPVPPNRNPDDPLPTFWPAAESPDLKLSIDKGLISLFTQVPLIPDTDRNFLVRWWVNGKPVEFLSLDKSRLSGLRAVQEVMVPATIRWQLDLDPAQLHAQPGDKIEMQVLSCTHGWDYAPRGDVLAKTQFPRMYNGSSTPPVLMTNKISWTLEKPPATAPK